MPSAGEVIERLRVGAVEITVRHSCVRRDLYELRTQGPLPPGLRERLSGRGPVKGSDALFVVEVEGVHQLTCAPAAGRLVVMPRLSTTRPAQRAAALELAALLASLLEP